MKDISKVGLVGYPVEHSISPALHNACFEHLKLPYEYGLYPVEPSVFDKEIENIKKKLAGFNVTIPHKERILPHLDDIDGTAAAIGAVNCVKNESGKWKGYNTDAAGFIRSVKEDVAVPGLKVYIIGAGGVAKAAAAALAKSGAARIHIKDIDSGKAARLRRRLEKYYPEVKISQADDFAAVSKCGMLVNATPSGMADDNMPVPAQYLHEGLYVFDCVYNRATPLLRTALEKGLKCRNGLDMLIYQAAEAFRIWTGREAPVEVMRKAASI